MWRRQTGPFGFWILDYLTPLGFCVGYFHVTPARVGGFYHMLFCLRSSSSFCHTLSHRLNNLILPCALSFEGNAQMPAAKVCLPEIFWLHICCRPSIWELAWWKCPWPKTLHEVPQRIRKNHKTTLKTHKIESFKTFIEWPHKGWTELLLTTWLGAITRLGPRNAHRFWFVIFSSIRLSWVCLCKMVE